MGRIIVILVILVFAGLGALYLLGPRTPSEATVTFDPASIGADPQAYLAAAEAKVANIRPGLAKEIVWAYPASRAKTPLSIVYIHGFSASKGEVRPVPDKVAAALVLISPNFGVQASGAGLLTGPWGLQIAELLIGKERGFEPANDLQKQFWTYTYPTKATLPMAATVALARRQSYDKVTIPALFIVSDGDQVIKPDEAKAVAAAWGGPHQLMAVDNPGDPSSHVLAGDALSPKMTEPTANKIVEWIKSLGLTP